MSDSISGERLGIAVRKGTGERLKKVRQSGTELTVESLKPLLDRWQMRMLNSCSRILPQNKTISDKRLLPTYEQLMRHASNTA
jgi:hypothetical protein